MIDIQNVNLRNSGLTVITLMMLLASVDTSAKLNEVQGLPQDIENGPVATAKDGMGNVILQWIRNRRDIYTLGISAENLVVDPPKLIAPYSGNKWVDVNYLLKGNGDTYTSLWGSVALPESGYNVKAIESNDLSNVMDLGLFGGIFGIYSRKQGGFAVASSTYAKLFDSQGHEESSVDFPSDFSAVAIDGNDDFFLVNRNKTNSPYFELRKGSNEPTKVYALQVFKPNNVNPNFRISGIEAVTNNKGDILLVWNEFFTKVQYSPVKSCSDKNMKACSANALFYYSVTETQGQTLAAQRFNSDLSPKDQKPIPIVSYNGKSKYYIDSTNAFKTIQYPDKTIFEININMDDDGDFVVAYTVGKTITVKLDTDNYAGQQVGSDLFVKQFVLNKNGALVSGKTLKLSSLPKSAYKQNNGVIKNSHNIGASIIVTDPERNEYLVAWSNEYMDTYEDPNRQVEVCRKYKKDIDGYQYCVEYKLVPAEAVDHKAALKALRYTKQ